MRLPASRKRFASSLNTRGHSFSGTFLPTTVARKPWTMVAENSSAGALADGRALALADAALILAAISRKRRSCSAPLALKAASN